MVKVLYGNSLLNTACAKILHSDFTAIKYATILVMLLVSMLIIFFEMIFKKLKPGKSDLDLPKRKHEESLSPIKKLA